MIQITNETIDQAALLDSVQSPLAGAVVLFMGTTRELTGDKTTLSLQYDCYREMAESELQKLEAAARDKWPLIACEICHRIGPVAVGEASVVVAVSSAHRDAAFAAGRWLIDTLKETVPIWKQEQWADGSTEWVHPGVAPTSKPSTPPTEDK